MQYILQGSREAKRLDKQTSMRQFSLDSELRGISFRPGSKVLDVGCGSGILCRYLEQQFQQIQIFGCDLSQSSLEYAEKSSLRKETHYFLHDFINKPFSEKFDFVFNRLVAHHLTEEKLLKGYRNCHDSLNRGGEICVIDPDGLFLNLGTRNLSLQKFIEKINSMFTGNLKVGRMIPSILKECGFKNVKWRIEVMDFQGEDRKKEVEQWEERFENSLPFYISTLGNELEARRFMELYLEEASRDEIPMFYNKFIVRGMRP
jgi:SAM-dependent methyltransferase